MIRCVLSCSNTHLGMQMSFSYHVSQHEKEMLDMIVTNLPVQKFRNRCFVTGWMDNKRISGSWFFNIESEFLVLDTFVPHIFTKQVFADYYEGSSIQALKDQFSEGKQISVVGSEVYIGEHFLLVLEGLYSQIRVLKVIDRVKNFDITQISNIPNSINRFSLLFED